MAKRAFVIAGGWAAAIANDVADFHYHAAAHVLPAGAQVPMRSNAVAETQLMVERGSVEFMVGGAVVYVLSGDFVRVAPGAGYAYRNAGIVAATILVRTTSPDAHKRVPRPGFGFAA